MLQLWHRSVAYSNWKCKCNVHIYLHQIIITRPNFNLLPKNVVHIRMLSNWSFIFSFPWQSYLIKWDSQKSQCLNKLYRKPKGKSRDKGVTLYTRKTSKTKRTTQKAKHMGNADVKSFSAGFIYTNGKSYVVTLVII